MRDVWGSSIRKAKFWEFLLERFDEFGSDFMFEVVFLVVVTFLYAGVASDGGYINHPIPDFRPKILVSIIIPTS